MQDILDKYYKKPFSSKANYREDKIPGVAKSVHGSMHACRTTIWALMLMGLAKQKGIPIKDKDVYLTSLATTLHDSGREEGGRDFWDGKSAENAKAYLKDFCKDETDAEKASTAIGEKDKPGTKTLEQKIVHDADCLDIMRCCEDFRRTHLDFQELISPELEKKISDFIKKTEEKEIKIELEKSKKPLSYLFDKLKEEGHDDICEFIASGIKGENDRLLIEGLTN